MNTKTALATVAVLFTGLWFLYGTQLIGAATPNAITFAQSVSSGTAVAAGTAEEVGILVVRPGADTSPASANYSCVSSAGYTPIYAATGILNWGPSDAGAKTIGIILSPFSSGVYRATITCTLSGANGAVLGAITRHVLTVVSTEVPPPPTTSGPVVCPPPEDAYPGSLTVKSFFGVWEKLRMKSGQISYYKVLDNPTDMLGNNSAVVFTQDQEPAHPPEPVVTEFSVSRCPGVIDKKVPQCYYKNTAILVNKIMIYTKPVSIPASGVLWNSQATIGDRGCWAPSSEGQWYLNVRWTYSGDFIELNNIKYNCVSHSTYPSGTTDNIPACGFSMAWNMGSNF